MSREPIIIGLDESPIIIQAKGVDWSFNPDPPAAFIVKLMQVAETLKKGDLTGYEDVPQMLGDLLTEPAQRKQWDATSLGFQASSGILMAYLEVATDLPTPPSSQSGKPRGDGGRK